MKGINFISGSEPGSSTGQYPVIIRLKEIFVQNTGINYDINDQIVISPNFGAELRPIFGSFGKVVGVDIISKGEGFDTVPSIYVDSEVGTNAKLIPVFEFVRFGSDEQGNINALTPPELPEGVSVMQVTDCVILFLLDLLMVVHISDHSTHIEVEKWLVQDTHQFHIVSSIIQEKRV